MALFEAMFLLLAASLALNVLLVAAAMRKSRFDQENLKRWSDAALSINGAWRESHVAELEYLSKEADTPPPSQTAFPRHVQQPVDDPIEVPMG